MPAVAAITPAPAPTAASPAAAAAGNGTSAPFRLQLGDTGQDVGQAAAAAQPARPPPKADARPASGKATDKLPAAQPAPPTWLMAMLGGAAVPAQPAIEGAAPAASAAADGMPAAPGTSGSTAAVAKPEAKAGRAARPLPVAAGPAVGQAAHAVDAKDADTDAAGDVDIAPAAPAAAQPVTPEHGPVPVHAAAAETPAAAPQPHPQAVADTASAFQAFARVLDAAHGESTAAAATPAAPHTSLDTGHPEWPQALADQVQWQLGREVQEARLELHPRDLGTVQVQVRITSEGAEVRFAATHPQAREALQAALPQLRSLLQGDGVALAQSQVGAHSSWQAPAQQQRQPQAGQGAAAVSSADEAPAAAAPRVVRIGLVDDFA